MELQNAPTALTDRTEATGLQDAPKLPVKRMCSCGKRPEYREGGGLCLGCLKEAGRYPGQETPKPKDTRPLCQGGCGGHALKGYAYCLDCLEDGAYESDDDSMEYQEEIMAEYSGKLEKEAGHGPESALEPAKQAPPCTACGKPALTKNGKIMKNGLCGACHGARIKAGHGADKPEGPDKSPTADKQVEDASGGPLFEKSGAKTLIDGAAINSMAAQDKQEGQAERSPLTGWPDNMEGQVGIPTREHGNESETFEIPMKKLSPEQIRRGKDLIKKLSTSMSAKQLRATVVASGLISHSRNILFISLDEATMENLRRNADREVRTPEQQLLYHAIQGGL